ncbi:MAG TPA: GSU2403 family nucleotidyltransferase fold protein [Bryobacteraceae bacterium]|nr:GSU2403 family nucleotidyltransferase fold protein [Bryobacteraceae bacterium]
MNRHQIPEPFTRLLAALQPWLDQVVIVGGWAHRLYRLHPNAQALAYPPLFTLDADVALPRIVNAGAADIRRRLLNFGFTEEFSGDAHPPAAHYRSGDGLSGFYAEFVTPLKGSELDRRQRRKTTVEIAGALTQQLRHIELLLQKPWTIDFRDSGFTGPVQVANPVAFLVQKILIHGKREPGDRAKDILYMRDTLEVFGPRLPELAALWRDEVEPQLNPAKRSAIRATSRKMFGEISNEIRHAARISRERSLSPEEIRQVCNSGFVEVFGGR